MEEFKNHLSQNTGDFWVSSNIKILESPSSIEFLREAVASYQPVIIRGLMKDWPALQLWNINYFENVLRSKHVMVNITPDGLGDCVKKIDGSDFFVYPFECCMDFSLFFKMMTEREKDDAVAYLSEQNDNLRTKFTELLKDIPSCIKLGEDAFGLNSLEAINLWIGDERSVSSVHKDHYENLYAVINGEKTFVLLPPTDIIYMNESQYETKIYQRDDSSNLLRIKQSDLYLSKKDCPTNSLNWIKFDPDILFQSTTTRKSTTIRNEPSQFHLTHPIKCTVKQGEMLYIPSLWYHRVSQTELTIAVNYWYEQRFDFRYALYDSIKAGFSN